jgi:hypothetical protein
VVPLTGSLSSSVRVCQITVSSKILSGCVEILILLSDRSRFFSPSQFHGKLS